MFWEGQIIYFTPFYFKNGNTAKNKYFIVIKNIGYKIIIASLPTRSNKAPALITVAHGCIDNEDWCFNCYVFSESKIVSDNGFCFPMNTYVYGNEVEDYEAQILSSVYSIEGVDYDVVGTLITEEYNALYNCLKNSQSLKRGIRRIL